MWATPDESSEYITGLYRRACAHADGVIAALDLAAPGSVRHWPADRRDTTLGVLLIRMVPGANITHAHVGVSRQPGGSGGSSPRKISASGNGKLGAAQRTRVTHERRAWDSNPRAGSPLLAIFKTAAIGH